jgi:hypothetical protein
VSTLEAGRTAYSVTDVGRALGLSDGAAIKMIARGQIKSVKIGKRHFIAASLLHVLLAGQSSQAKEMDSG